MIRIAAVGDIHFDLASHGRIRDSIPYISENADVLLLAGDLTQTGSVEEARVLAQELDAAPFPVVAVLGNHDYHLNQERELTHVLSEAGITVLEGTAIRIAVRDRTIGIAGIKGFGGGYLGACGSEFGEPEMKEFIRHTKMAAERLKTALHSLDTDYRIALLHYAPIPDTLLGEKPEIYPFLGSYLLSEAVDEARADVVFHGHAHKGVEKGITLGGIPVRNVALPVIRHACNVYHLNKDGLSLGPRIGAASDAR